MSSRPAIHHAATWIAWPVILFLASDVNQRVAGSADERHERVDLAVVRDDAIDHHPDARPVPRVRLDGVDLLRWIELRGLVMGWARELRLYITEPSLRPALHAMLRAMLGTVKRTEDDRGKPLDWAPFGYALLVGRK